MLKINVSQLVFAVQDADSFTQPDMSEGTAYLYNHLYAQLSRGEDVTLSSLNFDAFEDEDIRELDDLFSNIFEKNGHQAGGIISTLRGISPVCKTVAYV